MTAWGFVIFIICFWLCVGARVNSYSKWEKRKVTELLEGQPPWTRLENWLVWGMLIGFLMLVIGIGSWLWDTMP